MFELKFQIVIDFNNNPKYGCDVNAFLQNWSRYGPNLRTNVNRNIVTDWEQSIENLLLLLQVFPSKSCHLPFNEAIKKLIVFRVVSFFYDFLKTQMLCRM